MMDHDSLNMLNFATDIMNAPVSATASRERPCVIKSYQTAATPTMSA